MPRYYFDIGDNDACTRDETGLELDDLQTAKDEAARGLADLAQDVLPDTLDHEMSIEGSSAHGSASEVALTRLQPHAGQNWFQIDFKYSIRSRLS
jgi:hypothetical protein